MTPDKRVTGEKVRDTLSFIEKLNGKEIVELENAIDEALTQYHQDLMSEVLKDIDLPWLLKEQDRGEFGHVTSELGRLVAKYEPLKDKTNGLSEQ